MKPVQINEKVTCLSVDDLQTDLFEGLWSLGSAGVSYNSYLVQAGKNVLVDLSRETTEAEFISRLKELIDPTELDYVVINHVEPDHTGALHTLRELAPQVTFLATAKALPMLRDFYGLEQNVRAVADGEVLDLGTDRLRFVHTPFVHWPETMMTYLEDSQILFSCDGFGSYGVTRGQIFDADHPDLSTFEAHAQRYFATIVSTFSKPVTKAIKKLADTPLKVVAPSHGLVWKQDPGHIVELYARWADYANGPAQQGVTVLFGTMYGNTRRMLEAVLQGLDKSGVSWKLFDVARADPADMLTAIWSQQGVLIGAPTYEGSLFPPVAHILDTAAHKRIRNRKVARFGSYGWNAGAQGYYESLITPLRWQQQGVLEFAGAPGAEELAAGVTFGEGFGQVVKATFD